MRTDGLLDDERSFLVVWELSYHVFWHATVSVLETRHQRENIDHLLDWIDLYQAWIVK